MENVMPSISMSDFRSKIKDYINKMKERGVPVIINIRNKPVGIFVPYDEYEAIVSKKDSYKESLAHLIANNLLEGAPPHLKKAQLTDLLTLSEENLKLMLDVRTFPIPSQLKNMLIMKVGEDIITRLLKRIKIATAIADAEKEGLFEISEHLSVNQG